jgi:hypothetical protein
MPHSEAQAWWADVQHVREAIERRRAGAADPSAPLDAPEERRFARAAEESLPMLDDLDWSSSLPERSGGRFEHTSDHTTEVRTSRRGDRTPAGRADNRPFDRDEPFDFDTERAALETSRHDRRATERPRRERPAADRHERSAAERRTAERPRRERDAADPRHDRSPAERDAAERPGGDRARPEPLAADRPRGERAPSGVAVAPPEYELEQAPTAGVIALSPPRRTVQITGRTVAPPSLPRLVEVERRRPARRPAERVGPRPDRVALWAVLLGFFLILVAATSSHATTQPAHVSAPVALQAPAR